MATLPPCNTCGRRKFRFGGQDRIRDAVEVAKGAGLLRIAKGFVDHMRGVPTNPLLECEHCRSIVVFCPSCREQSRLAASPRQGEILNCPACQLGFGWCEWDPEFEEMLQAQTPKPPPIPPQQVRREHGCPHCDATPGRFRMLRDGSIVCPSCGRSSKDPQR